MPTSKLFWNEETKQLEVEVTNNKKVTKRWICPENQIAPNVPRTVSENDNFEVDFDRDPTGNILRVRLKDETWQGENKLKQSIDYQGIKQKAAETLKENKQFHKDYPANPQEKSKGKVDMPNEFHNPYNFVPAPPRNVSHPELGDNKACGHDRYLSDKFTGKLTVEMTVKTPLLILDTARMSVNSNDPKHKEFPVRVQSLVNEDGNVITDENGKIINVPIINPTAIKGMLRSGYEAVTNSRFSVFGETERLAFRAEVGEGLFAVPARIEKESGEDLIVLYTGKSEIEEYDGGPKITGYKRNGQAIRQSQFAAWLESYEKNGFSEINGKKIFKPSNHAIRPRDDNSNLPKHSERAWAWIEYDNSKEVRFTFYKVKKLSYEENSLGDAPNTSCEKVEGFICKTGKNMANKHDERFFFNPTHKIKLEKKHRDFWNSLIKNYRKQHKSDYDSPPKDKVRHGFNAGKEYSLEWSRHIRRTTTEETSEKANLIGEKLREGTLCYARVKWNGKDFEVLELYPVMISRRLHKVSPDSLLGDGLKPASDINKLSPADRVFGCVIKDNKNKKQANAYRGQIRIGSVTTERTDAIQTFEGKIPLNILGQPKPQQGRFYVAENSRGEAQPKNVKRNNAEAGYQESRGLRGRKVYPHHTSLPEDYWFEKTTISFTDDLEDKTQMAVNPAKPNFFREYLRPKKDNKQQRDSQNRSIEGWVKQDTLFKFDIHFTNLSEAELGALIWLLQLPPEHFHRLGGGKPLGFGSVRLELDGTKITSGKDLKDFYISLGEMPNQSKTPEECKSVFERAIETANYQNILEAFKIACRGFTDNLPVHYPRARNFRILQDKVQYVNNQGQNINDNDAVAPNPDGKSFEWFVENAKEKIEQRQKINNNNVRLDILPNSKPGIEEIRPRFVLDNLWEKVTENGKEIVKEDSGLPILLHKKS